MALDPERLPVLVGGGRFTQRAPDPATALSPLGMIVRAAELAAADMGVGEEASRAILREADAFATVNLGAIGFSSVLKGGDDNFIDLYANYPRSLANAFGANPPAAHCFTIGGPPDASGHSPLAMINELAGAISSGEVKIGVVSGCEFLDTLGKASAQGYALGAAEKEGQKALGWGEDPGAGPPVKVGPAADKDSYPRKELLHGLIQPIRGYPLFEQALRGHYGRSLQEHQEKISEMWAGMNRVAAADPEHVWFPQPRTAAEIMDPTSPGNRWVGFPYTKFHCSFLNVDQGAACIIMSLAEAQRRGVPEAKLVFLHGCAEAYEQDILKRTELHRSHAMRLMGEAGLKMAGLAAAQIQHFDIYSCFPCAVQIMTRELGVPEEIQRDGSRLTTTGGIPFHGGPGANYSMHGVVTMMERLRQRPGEFGCVTANGGILSKHALTILSTQRPSKGPWQRPDPAVIKQQMESLPAAEVAETPNGVGTIETYTVAFFSADRPNRGILVGRMDEGPDKGKRFVATTVDQETMREMMERDLLRQKATVSSTSPNAPSQFKLLPSSSSSRL